jgi:hypothetical protein
MNKTVLLLAGVGIAAFAVWYLTKSGTPATATSGQPINSLPARAFSLTGGSYNPQGQPPQPIFTPASGVAVAEGLLSAFGGGGSVNQALSQSDVQPQSFDTTDTSTTTTGDTGSLTTYWA